MARDISRFERQFYDEHYDLVEKAKDHEKELGRQIFKNVIAILGDEFKDKLKVHILTGSPTEEVVDFHNDQPMDFFIVGKKKDKRGSARFAKELIRRVNVPVLMIPLQFNKNWQLKSISVPYDFSENSDKALLAAEALYKQNGAAKIECFNVVDVPNYETALILTQHLMIEKLKKERKEAFENKIRELNLESKPSLKLQSRSSSVRRDIMRNARKNQVSLIIMGAKGHSLIERFFIGSVAEGVISRNNRFPLLIVK